MDETRGILERVIGSDSLVWKATRNRLFRFLLKFLIVLLVSWFVWRVFSANLRGLDDYRFSLQYGWLVCSFSLVAAYFLFQSLLWHFLLISLGIPIRRRSSMKVWFLSLPGKYLPGKLAYLAGRVYLHEDKDVSRKKVTLGLYLESITILFSSLIVVCATAPLAGLNYPAGFVYTAAGGLLVLLPLVHPALVRRILNYLAGKWSLSQLKLGLSGRELSLFILGHTLNQGLVAGLFLLTLMRAVSPDVSVSLITASAVNNAVGVSGMVLFIFPAGIGVREGLYAFLMESLFAAPAPVIVALLARLLITAVEVGSAGAVLVAGAVSRKIIGNVPVEKA